MRSHSIFWAILGMSFCIASFLLYNHMFTDKYLKIMAQTSMKDDTNSLTTSQRKSLRDLMNEFFPEMGIRISFHVAESGAFPDLVGENNLRIAINTKNNYVNYEFPIRLKDVLGKEANYLESEFVNNFNICYERKKKELGDCLHENLSYIREELFVKRAIVLPRQ